MTLFVDSNNIQSNLDYPDSLGPDEIVRIIEDMNINEKQKLITLRKRHLGPVHTFPEICENANFFYEYGLRPHISSIFSGRVRKFLKMLSRVEIFLSDTNTYTCGRSYLEICEYAYVILLDPVFTASIKQTWRTATLCLLC